MSRQSRRKWVEKSCTYKTGNRSNTWAVSQRLYDGLCKLDHRFVGPRPFTLPGQSHTQSGGNFFGIRALAPLHQKRGKIFQIWVQGRWARVFVPNMRPNPKCTGTRALLGCLLSRAQRKGTVRAPSRQAQFTCTNRRTLRTNLGSWEGQDLNKRVFKHATRNLDSREI